jgi:hypothetical protein
LRPRANAAPCLLLRKLTFWPKQRCRQRPRNIEAAQLALPLGTIAGLDQEQEPERAGGETGDRGRLEPVTFHSLAVFCDCGRINANQVSASLNQAFLSIGLEALAAFWRHSSTLA